MVDETKCMSNCRYSRRPLLGASSLVEQETEEEKLLEEVTGHEEATPSGSRSSHGGRLFSNRRQ